MMKKVLIFFAVIVSCCMATHAYSQGVPADYDSVEVDACGGSVVHLPGDTIPVSPGFTKTIVWYYGDASTIALSDTANTGYSFTFAGSDTVFWRKRTLRFGFGSTITWIKYKIHRSIVTAPEVQVVACGSYIWQKPSGTSETLINTGVYADTVTTTCTQQFYSLNLTIPTGVKIIDYNKWCFPHYWRDTVYDAYNIGGQFLYGHDTIGGCYVYDTIIATNPVQRTYDTIKVTACDSYYWAVNDVLYESESDTTIYTNPTVTGMMGSGGCDSMQVLQLRIKSTKHGVDTVVACDSYRWRDSIIYVNSTVTPTDTINRGFFAGCDSVIHLHLTVNRSSVRSEQIEVCDRLVDWHGNTYTVSGIYIFDTINAEGCPDTTRLSLTVNNSVRGGTDVVSACDQYNWKGKSYMNETNWPTAHIEDSIVFATPENCDSVVYLDLTLGMNRSYFDTQEACEEYVWRNHEYTVSGVYEDSVTNAGGCVDHYRLNLTVNHVQEEGESMLVCSDEYFWYATQTTYTESGTYDAPVNYALCTQAKLYLTLLGIETPPVRNLVVKDLGDSDNKLLLYPRNDNDPEYFYQWQCNLQDIPGATRQYLKFDPSQMDGKVITVAVSGIEFGKLDTCQSVSGPYVVYNTVSTPKVITQPNPNMGRFTVTLSLDDDPVETAVLYNANGTQMSAVEATAGVAKFEEVLRPGIYLVVVTTKGGKTYTDKVVIEI